ncbi:DUF4382 domain-containing protein [Sulfurovum sp.]|uniref:DUF4382 domain-containing protein n=1 Tax=Sulfurovum sp. TaxID=1969726 RepID=UPI0028680BCF|nr:DUF4382 domain-containing protein [Sulfurovum sp.]
MKRFHKLIGIALSLTIATLISGCGGGGDTVAAKSTGKLSLSVTDAPPKLGDDVTEVNIAVIGIEYNHNGSWTAADDFVPQTFNLLDLQNGKSLHLGDMVLPAGHYNDGIRFILAAPQNDGDVKSNPDCNITFADGRSEPLFVPSGAQSGYKGKGEFDITADARIEVTADFDVHKSIVVTGKDKYILKPVIRLVVNELSGSINGTVVDVAGYNSSESLVVYTYEQGTYVDTEAEGEIIFANSISSSDVNRTDGHFMLSFLGEGSYSLVTALYIDNVFDKFVDIEYNVEVLLNTEPTVVNIDTSN